MGRSSTLPEGQDTGAAHIEAHNFQADLEKLQGSQCRHSLVSAWVLRRATRASATKESLTFKLLADPDHKVVRCIRRPHHAWDPEVRFSAITVLIDPSGKVVQAWSKVDPNTHSETVLAYLANREKVSAALDLQTQKGPDLY